MSNIDAYERLTDCTADAVRASAKWWADHTPKKPNGSRDGAP